MSQADWNRAYFQKLDGQPVTCPVCGRTPVDWRLAGDPVSRMGYAILWCTGCGKGSHLSRVRFPEGVDFIDMSDTEAVAKGVPNIQS